MIFRGYPKIIIASTGRSGSTMLFNAVADSLIMHRLHIAPHTPIANFIKRLSTGYVDRIKTLPEKPYLIIKTHDICDLPPETNYKYIFVYGDSLESALSVEQMVEKKGQQWFSDHQYHLRAFGDHQDLFQKDVLAYQKQLESWLTQSEPNIVCVYYDELWDKSERFSDLLGFKVQLPPQRQRSKKPYKDNVNEQLFKRLDELRIYLKKEYESTIGHD